MALETPLPPPQPTPLPHKGRSLPVRSASLADSVAEGGKPRRRILTRAANLLTTKGEPVRSLAESMLQIEATASYPPTTPSKHRRSHSNSVPSPTRPGEDVPVKISRRRSDGAASLGLGGSIRRTLREMAEASTTYLGRSKSRTKSKDSNLTNASPRRSAPPPAPVLVPQRSISSQSDTSTTVQPATRSRSIKGHLRSASDAVLRRPPRLPHSSSDPGFYHEDNRPQYDTMVTETPTVASPDEILDAPQVEQASEDTAGLPKRPLSTIHEPEDTTAPPQSALPTTSLEPATPVTSPPSASASASEVPIPSLLLNGVPMLKVSAKKQKRYFFRLDPDEGQILYLSKKQRISEFIVEQNYRVRY